MIENEIINF